MPKGFKVVIEQNGKYYSFAPAAKSTEYIANRFIQPIIGNGPLSVFDSECNARIFMCKWESDNAKLFACEYKRSKRKSMWRNLLDSRIYFRSHYFPTGTILADKVKLLGEPID